MSHLTELMKRGLSFREASMAVEAIYSCAVEGVKQPSTKEEKQSFTDPKTGLKKDRTTIVLPISNTNTKKMYEWSM